MEKEMLYESHGRWLWLMRLMPSHTIHTLAGVVMPPHERDWANNYIMGGYKENNTVASRGTSKSFVHGSMAAELDTLLHKGLDTLVVSASGFRGGKLLLEDGKRLIIGELRSQKLPAPFLKNSLDNPKVIRQEPDRWIIKWRSHSQLMTVPSNNPDAMRGIRARKAVIDERNTFDGDVVQVVIRPMLNVGGDFDKIASAESGNAIYQISTIDYTFRDYWKEIDTMRRTAKREYDAMQSMRQKDWSFFDRLMTENKNELQTASIRYSRYDYTDLLIPEFLTDAEDDVTYQVHYPMRKGLVKKDVMKWDDRDGMNYWYTYPVDKQSLEEPLLNGTMDEDLWLAEQRNVFIEASGAVYPDSLIKKASEMAIYSPGEIPGFQEWAEEFFPPVLYTCGDVCVVGIDYAREKDDFAIIVIRLGPLSQGKFNPSGWKDEKGRICFGETPWSSVIWAESWPHTMASTAADKIRELRERFNIINMTSMNNGCGGIGMDFRGGGSAVRDELANPKPPVMPNGQPDPSWKEPIKIFDPTDESYEHYAAFDDKEKYWSGLRLLTPQNSENWEWTRYTKAGMEQSGLYIGYWEAPSTWSAKKGINTTTGQRDQNSDEYLKWIVGYNAIKKFKNQLVRLQVEMTPSGLMRVMMPGKKGTEEGKKDLYSAFIYGWHIAREHLVNATKQNYEAPNIEPVIVNPGGFQGGITTVGWGFKNTGGYNG
jgi:hypothetical protein